MRGTESLRSALEALPLRIETIRVDSDRVPLSTYPDGPRPTSTVVLEGKGAQGSGEHVGWTDAEHAAFQDAVTDVRSGDFRLGDWISQLHSLPPYDRAALEAAAIDLALRQHKTNLFRFAGKAPMPVRYVVSFARTADPLAEMGTLERGDVEWKIDADPDWPSSVWQRLASRGRVAVVDFKMSGSADDHERACRHLPEAWIEDPKPGSLVWSPALAARRSVDASVTSASAFDRQLPLPAAVNVKPARMGSVLEAISCLVRAERRGLTTYMGGMFEVGIGRRQLLALAALFCPDGPNDIAPLRSQGERPSRLHADHDAPGFAGDPPT